MRVLSSFTSRKSPHILCFNSPKQDVVFVLWAFTRLQSPSITLTLFWSVPSIPTDASRAHLNILRPLLCILFTHCQNIYSPLTLVVLDILQIFTITNTEM